MPVPAVQDIAHYRGDTLAILVRLWDDPEETIPSDLSGSTVTSQVRNKVDGEILTELLVTTDTNVVTLAMLPVVCQTMPKTVVYDCQVDWDSDEMRVQTVVKGKITFDPDVTHV